MNWITIAGINGFLAIVLGAFGSHGLSGRLEHKYFEVWQTAVLYHLVCSAVFIALALNHYPKGRFRKSLRAFLLGQLLFCGSLYLLAVSSARFLGFITPFGGVTLLVAWILVVVEGKKSILKSK